MSLGEMRLRVLSAAFRRVPANLKGKARLSRLLLGKALRRRDVEVRAGGFSFLLPTVTEPIGFHLLVDGCYEPDLACFVTERLRSGDVFIDVGANVGVFTLLAAGVVGSGGIVVAVEASPRIFPYLENNCRLNGMTNVVLQHCAAAAQEASADFYEAPPTSFGMGSLAPQFNAPPVRVACRSLDRIAAELSLPAVDGIKVDVEGFEADVFRGAGQILTGQSRPWIVFEFCDWAESRAGHPLGESQRVLMEAGYNLWPLRTFATSRPPLGKPLVEGFEMLVALPES